MNDTTYNKAVILKERLKRNETDSKKVVRNWRLLKCDRLPKEEINWTLNLASDLLKAEEVRLNDEFKEL